MSGAGPLDRTAAEALVEKHLGGHPRAAHSRFVGALMAALAPACGGDPELWRLTGLCHDLDYLEVADERHRHGVAAAGRLEGRLPAAALAAIAAHDHRTGIAAEGALDHGLRLCDAVAVMDAELGRDVLAALWPDRAALAARLGARRFLAEVAGAALDRLPMRADAVAAALARLPAQASAKARN